MILAFLFVAVLITGCRQAMAEQPKIEPLEPSVFFENFQSARPIPDNAVPRQATVEPEWFYSGMQDGEVVQTVPLTLTEELLARGQERYNIYCAPCHGLTGDGEGIVARRGFPEPPSYHSERLRQAPAGYFFQVITDGFGTMYSYAARVKPADRWAIIAYIRALQLSQNAPVDELPPEDIEGLEATE